MSLFMLYLSIPGHAFRVHQQQFLWRVQAEQVHRITADGKGTDDPVAIGRIVQSLAHSTWFKPNVQPQPKGVLLTLEMKDGNRHTYRVMVNPDGAGTVVRYSEGECCPDGLCGWAYAGDLAGELRAVGLPAPTPAKPLDREAGREGSPPQVILVGGLLFVVIGAGIFIRRKEDLKFDWFGVKPSKEDSEHWNTIGSILIIVVGTCFAVVGLMEMLAYR